MSPSLGLAFFASSAAADMICPAWQYPHCGTSISCQATCNGCIPSADSPSIVVHGALLGAVETGVMHDRTARPRRCTVHAPHWPMPQPNLVPVRLSTSRSTQSKGVSGATSTVLDLPFTLSVTTIGLLPLIDEGHDKSERALWCAFRFI